MGSSVQASLEGQLGSGYGGAIDLGAEGEDFELEPAQATLELNAEQEARGGAPGTRAYPTGASPEPEALRVDGAEVVRVAGYGAPPGGWLMTPIYAVRVRLRQRALKRELGALQAQRRACELERDALLSALAEQLRPRLEADDRFQRFLMPARDLDGRLQEHRAALAQTNQAYAQRKGTLDVELEGARQRLQSARALSAERQADAEQSELDLRRAQAKLKRVQIEMRAVREAAAQRVGPQGGPLPAEHAQQLAELAPRANAAELETKDSQQVHAGRSAELARAQAEEQAAERGEQQVLLRQQALAREFRPEFESKQRGLSELDDQRRGLLADAGRAVLGLRGAIPLSDAELVPIADADAKVWRVCLDAELHLRALDAFDAQRAKQGELVLGSVVGLLVLWIAVKVIV